MPEPYLMRASSAKPYFIVFSAGACGLIIEIVAGRILAPTIGVSLYTWTSIIGVVLAGISVGNYLGGRAADRFPSSTTLGLILLAGGITSLSVLALVDVVSAAFKMLPIVTRIVMVTATLFFLPSLILGMVTPVVIKLRLTDLKRTGDVVGKIYAVSTAGSIFGTFVTGFVLIQWLGSRQTLLLVALILVLMALAFGSLWRVRVHGFAALGLLAVIGSVNFSGATINGDCTRESNYYCIRVSDLALEGGRQVKVLRLDQLLHSYVVMDDPTSLIYGYENVFAEIANSIAYRDPALRVLFIGGGGYTMPRYLEALYPDSTLEVIEIDPQVTRVAFEHLGLRPDTRIVTYNEDARMVTPRLPRGQYDLIFGDAFNDVSVPYHLTTLEFNEQVRSLLNEDGLYVANVIDNLHSGRFLKSYVNTLQRTFPYVYVLRDQPRWYDDSRYTYVVVASFRPLSPSALETANIELGRGQPVARIMPQDAFAAWLSSQRNVLLTDDYAPVDNMLASVLLKTDSMRETVRHFHSGLELDARDQLQGAIDEYSEALRLNPWHIPSHMSRGRAYVRLRQFEPAILDFGEAIRLDPEHAAAYGNRALAYGQLDMHAKAQQDFNQALALGYSPALLQETFEGLSANLP